MNNKTHLQLWKLALFFAVFHITGIAFGAERIYRRSFESLTYFINALQTFEFKGHSTYAADLAALFSAYPRDCIGVEISEGLAFVILSDGAEIVYDDGTKKSYSQCLQQPDIKNMFDQKYTPGRLRSARPVNYDPGRFRVSAFFEAVYGNSARQIRRNAVKVAFCGKRVLFNRKNGASEALNDVGKDLGTLVERRP